MGAHFFLAGKRLRGMLIFSKKGVIAAMEKESLVEVVSLEIERLGFECVLLEVMGLKKNPVIRLFIDKPGGVSIRDCTNVTKIVGLILDELDPFPGRYLLEVSSPGSNRPLSKAEHYRKFMGSMARVQWSDDSGVKRTCTGLIKSCVGDHLILGCESGEEIIPIPGITKANLVGVEYAIDKKIKRKK